MWARTAVWVAVTVSRRKRLANTVSECRNAIGAAHLPLATDGKYRVGPAVMTDVELFDRRLAAAAKQDALAAIATLRGALELVEGPVFTYRNAERGSYVWVDVENWISTWELKVTDAAEDLAQRCLELGDLDGAVWAARRGLDTSSTHTRLTKLLMQAHFAKGDARAAERVFQSHQSALEQLELDDVDGELVEFLQDARRAGRAAAS
jgi:DNA-binding SARP family transcriptional activator